MMAKKPELLAPARDREAFLEAIAAGADAIYCGIAGGLNARRKAAGIAEDELPDLCAFAHARRARVYVTANIVVKQGELAGAIEALGRYAAAGVDAFIIQDWGLLAEVRRALPGAEIHVSTQANVHDARGVALCARLGAARVTLSRELSLAEIGAIARAERERAAREGGTPCELEVFAHGAICPSYSGVCMLSSFLREGRSPNRGLCAQPCRLPFDLVGEEGTRLQPLERERPLCTHDNCAIVDIPGLAAAGVASLKLEGRMKPATYVHAVVAAWRSGLDGAGLRRRDLKRSFNRGLTDAYLRGTSGNELMSYERSGNRGELVGEVVGFEPEPGFVPRDGQQVRGEALVSLTASVSRGDSLELRHPAEPTRFLVVEVPGEAGPGQELRVRVPRPMPPGCEARVTKSVALERAAAEAVAAMEAELCRGDWRDYGEGGGSEGALAERARCAGTVGSEMLPGATSWTAGADDSEALSVAATQGAVSHNSGALIGASLQGADAGDARRRAAEAKPGVSSLPLARASDGVEICALVSNADEARALRSAGATRVYLDVSGIEASAGQVEMAHELNLVPVLDEVCREPDHTRLDPWVAAGLEVVVGNVSELALARELGVAAETRSCIPVHNVEALAQLGRLGARGVWLSPELSLAEIGELASAADAMGLDVALGISVFGRPRLMTCEHCVLQVAYGCNRNHASCRRRLQKHWLVNVDDRRLPTVTDGRGRSRVYLDEPVDLVSRAGGLVAAGVTRLLVDAVSTDVDVAEGVVSRLARGKADGFSVTESSCPGACEAGFSGLIDGGVA